MKKPLAIIAAICLLIVQIPMGLAQPISTKDAAKNALTLSTQYYKTLKTLPTWWDFMAVQGLTGVGFHMPKDNSTSIAGKQAIEALMLLAGGENPYVGTPDSKGDRITSLLAQRGQNGSFGTVSVQALALLALEGVGIRDAAAQQSLLSQQKADGGFAFVGDVGDVDATAFAILGMVASGVTVDSSALQSAKHFLDMSRVDGGFIPAWDTEKQPNPCSAAMALSAYMAMGATAEADLVAAHLLQFQRADGMFVYALKDTDGDPYTTAQATMALGDYVSGQCRLTNLALLSHTVSDRAQIGTWALGYVQTALQSKAMTLDANQAFCPKATVTVGEFATTLKAAYDPSNAFDATPLDWMLKKDLVKGHVIEATRAITRQEVAYALSRLYQLSESKLRPTDAKSASAEYLPHIGAVMAEGLMVGSRNEFRPTQTLNRQEMAKLAAIILGK